MGFAVGLMITFEAHDPHLTIGPQHERGPMTCGTAERDALKATRISDGERLEAMTHVTQLRLVRARNTRVRARFAAGVDVDPHYRPRMMFA